MSYCLCIGCKLSSRSNVNFVLDADINILHYPQRMAGRYWEKSDEGKRMIDRMVAICIRWWAVSTHTHTYKQLSFLIWNSNWNPQKRHSIETLFTSIYSTVQTNYHSSLCYSQISFSSLFICLSPFIFVALSRSIHLFLVWSTQVLWLISQKTFSNDVKAL